MMDKPSIIVRTTQNKLIREEKLINAGVLIAGDSPAGSDMAFTHSVLCQVGLPRSKVEGREFLRRSGEAWLNIQAGVIDEGNGPVFQPIPYGAMPRLALAHISTYAKRNNTRVVPVGDSANEFLRLLGYPTSGGKRGSHITLRKQMHALAACRLQLGFKGRTFNGQPVEQFDSWSPCENLYQKAIWPGQVTLSSSFFDEIIAHGVPLDNRAMHNLKGSSLALDIYAWLAYRLYRIEGRQVMLHWKPIRDQFAHEYLGKNANRDFRHSFLTGLKSVMLFYPKANVEVVDSGLILRKSPPPIKMKD